METASKTTSTARKRSGAGSVIIHGDIVNVRKRRSKMGEQADLLINGDCCQVCGCNFEDEGGGYPRTCNACGGKDGDTL